MHCGLETPSGRADNPFVPDAARLLLAAGSADEESALQAALDASPFATVGATTAEEIERTLERGEVDLLVAASLARQAGWLERIHSKAPDVPIVVVGPEGEIQVALRGLDEALLEHLDCGALERLPDLAARLLELAASRRRARAAEAELETQATRYRRLFESAPAALWEIDARAAWNLLVARDFGGASLDEVLMEAAARVEVRDANDEARALDLGPDERRVWRAILEAYLTGQRDLRVEQHFESGRVGLITARLPSHSRDLHHIVVALLDVTQQRQLQQAFLAAQRMEAIGQLASGIAHDFNNILMVVGTYAEFLRESIGEHPQATEDLEVIVDGVKRATALVGQLLAFSRRQTQKLERLDLNEVVARTERLMRRVLGEDIDLRADLADDLEPIRADPSQLDQVLMNLVVNARDAMPSGGVLTLRTRQERRSVPERHAPGFTIDAGDYAVLTVEDTGAGMSEEVASRIFEPFYTTKAERGSGLGLATVYGIVKQSGGYITVDSELGRGTTFEIFLPAAPPSGTPAEGIPRSSIDTRADGVILLVEDNPAVRRAMRRMLEERGYRVLEAPDPAEAIRVSAAHEGPIDALVTDVVLPGMNGVELRERIRRQRPSVGVVFTSGYADHGALRQALESHDAVFVQKPTGVDDLDGAIRRVRRRA